MLHYPYPINSKLPTAGISIFSKMSKLAAEYEAVNLAQGFPDFNPPEQLVEAFSKAMAEGFNQYAPSDGLPILRTQISQKIGQFYQVQYNPITEITITSGATQALFTAFSAFIQKGDEVILFDPSYDSYAPSIKLQGGVPVHIPLKAPDFLYDWELVERSINKKTRMIVVNSPHNPSGVVITESDIQQLDRLTCENGILILSDEVYEHILFDGYQHLSLSSHPRIRNKALVVSSFGKTYHTTGWKVGYVCAPAELMVEFRKAHQFTVFSVNTPAQKAYADFLSIDNSDRTLGAFYEKKRDFLIEGLKDTPFKILQPQGTYFFLADYSSISSLDDIAFTEWLCKEVGVALVPLSPFYHQNPASKLVRFCFAKKEETLLRAINRMKQL